MLAPWYKRLWWGIERIIHDTLTCITGGHLPRVLCLPSGTHHGNLLFGFQSYCISPRLCSSWRTARRCAITDGTSSALLMANTWPCCCCWNWWRVPIPHPAVILGWPDPGLGRSYLWTGTSPSSQTPKAQIIGASLEVMVGRLGAPRKNSAGFIDCLDSSFTAFLNCSVRCSFSPPNASWLVPHPHPSHPARDHILHIGLSAFQNELSFWEAAYSIIAVRLVFFATFYTVHPVAYSKENSQVLFVELMHPHRDIKITSLFTKQAITSALP